MKSLAFVHYLSMLDVQANLIVCLVLAPIVGFIVTILANRE